MRTQRPGTGEQGYDAAGIWVRRASRLTVARVGEEIASYWIGRGGKQVERPAEKDALGVAIAVDGKWFYVVDSSRLTADFTLAGHLAQKLETQVCWYALSNRNNSAALRLLGSGRAMRAPRDNYDDVVDFLDRNTMRCWDYVDIDLFDDVLHLHFAGVTGAMYDRGPAADAK